MDNTMKRTMPSHSAQSPVNNGDCHIICLFPRTVIAVGTWRHFLFHEHSPVIYKWHLLQKGNRFTYKKVPTSQTNFSVYNIGIKDEKTPPIHNNMVEFFISGSEHSSKLWLFQLIVGG